MNVPTSAAALAVLLALAGCADTAPGTAAPPAPTEVPSGATTQPAAATPTAAPATSRRTVFYLRDDAGELRLFKETHVRPASSAVVRDALTAMLEERPHDGDYTSIWPAGTKVKGARIEADLLVVDLSKEALGANAGAGAEALSVQQLVWTATTAAPAVKRVQLLVEGQRRSDLWGHVDISEPVSRDDPLEVLGLVWLDVDEGATLRRGAMFGGEATVFEATVSWEWRTGGKVVAEGFSNASEGAPGRGTWTAKVDVAPGSYELRAFESSAEDGRPLRVETKTVTVV